MSVIIELPHHADQTARNLRVWQRLQDDREITKFEGRIETDRHGQIIMTSPPGYSHSSNQFEIAYQLRQRLGENVRTECPLSTADRIKGVYVVWISEERQATAVSGQVLVKAAEICVEVLSPSNTPAEMEEKAALYFDAGANEVWLCGIDGVMVFHDPSGVLEKSAICPDFPDRIEA